MPPIGEEDEDLNVGAIADDQDTPDNQDDDADQDDPGEGDPPEDADELEISFGDDEPAEDAAEPDLIKRLRAENRRLAKEAAEAKRAVPAPVVQKIDPGPKPTMESCDYDEAKFEAEYEAWQGRVAEAKNAETAAEQAEAKKRQAFQGDVDRFHKHKTEMRASDFDDAEAIVAATLTKEQASALLQATDNSAKVIYALGKRPERLKALAAEGNIVKFIAQVAKLEGAVKVSTTRRTAPEPDVPVRGSARLAPTTDKHLERLEKAFERTGDRTEIIAYKKKLREQQAPKRR